MYRIIVENLAGTKAFDFGGKDGETNWKHLQRIFAHQRSTLIFSLFYLR
jgi:hypothetical protein